MTHRKRLHPERVVLYLGLALGITTWALGLTAFFTGNRQIRMWAGYAAVATLVVASTPLLTFLIVLAIQKFRRGRHD
jgi:hypothetical protein